MLNVCKFLIKSIRFESISVRDHITNLYAPRLIVEKTVADQKKLTSDNNGVKAVDNNG